MFDKLPSLTKEESEEVSAPEYEITRLEPEDDIYDEHVDYLEEEKGMSIDRDYPVLHVDGNEDHSIYAGPAAEDLVEDYSLPKHWLGKTFLENKISFSLLL